MFYDFFHIMGGGGGVFVMNKESSSCTCPAKTQFGIPLLHTYVSFVTTPANTICCN